MTTDSIDLDRLRNIPLFAELSDESLQTFLRDCVVEEAPAGTLVFSEGQRGDRFFVVLSGGVRIVRQIEGVGEEQLAMCRENAYFGELSMIDNQPRSADARAIEDTHLLVIRKAVLEERMFADDALSREILWCFVRQLATRVRETNEKLRAVYQMGLD